ncbi:hypothetical protein [Rubripirellula reticaptiva]|uniref:Peptidase MA-like domain-containing protein n=1 Tax=Rubripirellula reticaptiva TaxID=2528013 RepID=A0A5C6EKX6_9BACT|nr:hypothetical protein [Rubripirellula reticaptiva]TWU48231.1 hypothetical protein Poly59_50770 [Rubripirellula reticaptiva]
MEADSKLRGTIVAFAAGIVCLAVGLAATKADAANYRTRNFLIQAPDAQLAKQVGDTAEKYRHDLASYWLGQPLPPWPTPCPVVVIAGANLAAQGETNYHTAPVRDFQMKVVGTPERILDSVLPHEVTHTVLATHFGRPLPRWADEGICTTVEHDSEKSKHEAKLREFLSTHRGIAMNKLFLLTEYPNDVLPMYAQGYSVCRFLIEQQDAPTFIAFLSDYMQSPSWTVNIKKHYGYDSLAELQQYWLAWVAEGSGPVARFAKNAPPASASPSIPSPNAIASVRGDLSVPSSGVRPASATGPATNLIAPQNSAVLTTLASTESGGWYQRKRLEAVSENPALAEAPTIADPMVPPSVRNPGRYKSAQPQPEVTLGGGGQPQSYQPQSYQPQSYQPQAHLPYSDNARQGGYRGPSTRY